MSFSYYLLSFSHLKTFFKNFLKIYSNKYIKNHHKIVNFEKVKYFTSKTYRNNFYVIRNLIAYLHVPQNPVPQNSFVYEWWLNHLLLLLGVENNSLEYGVFTNVQKETFGQGLLEDDRPYKLTILEIW